MLMRPLFRWLKLAFRCGGDHKYINISFEYAEWLIQLSRHGNHRRELPAMVHIQANYALNTIITASQRANSLAPALRVFEMLLANDYKPDVFAYTALIDVLLGTVTFRLRLR